MVGGHYGLDGHYLFIFWAVCDPRVGCSLIILQETPEVQEFVTG